jgi:hypothetical protein
VLGSLDVQPPVLILFDFKELHKQNGTTAVVEAGNGKRRQKAMA